MSLGGATGYAINPARDLGPRIAHAVLPIPGKGGSDWSYSWIPVLGPILGGTYGALFYDAIVNQAYTAPFWIVSVVVASLLIGATVVELDRKSTRLNSSHVAISY